MASNEEDNAGVKPDPWRRAGAAFIVGAIVRALRRDGYGGLLTLEPHVTGASLFEYYRREVLYVKKLLAELPPRARRR